MLTLACIGGPIDLTGFVILAAAGLTLFVGIPAALVWLIGQLIG